MMYSRAYVEITNICNRHCTFCPGHARTPRRMTEEEFSLICDKLDGVTKYIYYHLMGEPLTHPLLPRFIEMANGRGFRSAVTTNGTLLAGVGDSLISSGVYKVNISVHSFEDDMNEQFVSYINDCLDFADKASRAGVLVIFRLWNNGCDGGRNSHIIEMMRSRFADGEWVFSRTGARIRHRLHLDFGDRFEWPDLSAEDGGDGVFCYGLSDHFGILCDGTVVPCCLDRNGQIALGNIFESDINRILSCERAQNMRKGFKCRHVTEELCRKCGYARRF